MYAPGIEPGAKVPAGGELAQTATFDLRQTQLKAAELKFAASHDPGRAINPQIVEGQLQGGLVIMYGTHRIASEPAPAPPPPAPPPPPPAQ